MIDKAALPEHKFPEVQCKSFSDGSAYRQGWNDAIDAIVYNQPPVDAVPVRCKDCKHRPIGTNRDDLEFPDDKCPCKCEDYWYSWKPSDNWFCGNGERKDDEAEEITSIIGRDATTVDAVPVRT